MAEFEGCQESRRDQFDYTGCRTEARQVDMELNVSSNHVAILWYLHGRLYHHIVLLSLVRIFVFRFLSHSEVDCVRRMPAAVRREIVHRLALQVSC